MNLEWDEAKRQATLDRRGLDFADCATVFAGPTFEFPDNRNDYGEARTVAIGLLDGDMIAIVYTRRRENLRIISMRKCNERERKAYRNRLG